MKEENCCKCPSKESPLIVSSNSVIKDGHICFCPCHKEEAPAYSPSVNIIRKILAKYITEWSNEMLCELANSIDLAVKNREAELIEEIEGIRRFESDYDDEDKRSRRDVRPYNQALEDILTKLKGNTN